MVVFFNASRDPNERRVTTSLSKANELILSAYLIDKFSDTIHGGAKHQHLIGHSGYSLNRRILNKAAVPAPNECPTTTIL